ncbi:MAG: RdgB/HAM1 family non-canonical purine NTP pyrophosphatase [Oscillospiraceae bacterium]|nr:RdgB/HAM1 family non-canonical purine NTP pyrophosphatase [Oscillospiraceae bacterium]
MKNTGKTFLIATRNPGKLEEMRRILQPLGIRAVTGADIGITLTEVDETGATYAENAFLKAAAACRESGLPAIADDSGLEVDALGGAPGVYSARYAGEGAGAAACVQKLLRELDGVPAEQRTARFRAVICCVFPSGEAIYAEGTGCEGRIGLAPTGAGGFGYDPVFYVGDRSFAQFDPTEKDAISHRGRALRAFQERIKVTSSEWFGARAAKAAISPVR